MKSHENLSDSTCNWLESIPKEDKVKYQKSDPDIGKIYQWKIGNVSRPKWVVKSNMNSKIKTYWSQWDRIVIENDILYRKWFHIKTSDVSL